MGGGGKALAAGHSPPELEADAALRRPRDRAPPGLGGGAPTRVRRRDRHPHVRRIKPGTQYALNMPTVRHSVVRCAILVDGSLRSSAFRAGLRTAWHDQCVLCPRFICPVYLSPVYFFLRPCLRSRCAASASRRAWKNSPNSSTQLTTSLSGFGRSW